MTKLGYTHLTMVTDRSGSMRSIATDAAGGINTFIEANAKAEGECSLTLIEFDSPSGLGTGDIAPWYHVVFDGPAADAPEYVLVGRGNTSLYDAVFRAMTETGERLAAMPEDERPETVLFVIMTDGQENASREVTLADVNALIKQQVEVYGWEVTFLGAGLDVARQAVAMGIAASNVTNFTPTAQGTHAAYAAHTESSLTRRSKGVATYAGKTEADGTVVVDEGRSDVTA